VFDDCVWWLCLMTVFDDCVWWLCLMTVFDDCVWWLCLMLEISIVKCLINCVKNKKSYCTVSIKTLYHSVVWCVIWMTHTFREKCSYTDVQTDVSTSNTLQSASFPPDTTVEFEVFVDDKKHAENTFDRWPFNDAIHLTETRFGSLNKHIENVSKLMKTHRNTWIKHIKTHESNTSKHNQTHQNTIKHTSNTSKHNQTHQTHNQTHVKIQSNTSKHNQTHQNTIKPSKNQ